MTSKALNSETLKVHSERVTARLSYYLAQIDAAPTPTPAHQAAAKAMRDAARAVADDLIANPSQVVEGMTAAVANPAIFDRMIVAAARDAGRAAMG